ncbi:biotin/lipoyl-binding protein [Erwinia sorbitola]|uniref:Biotin/lipoyl-binding protein n=2 Tax=Erwinia sorbitola TaxID=2681984 RepID=A0A6I6EEY7_9GAMM|nr:biotin/lipoyl-binding protein [Erwinia sorbitola]
MTSVTRLTVTAAVRADHLTGEPMLAFRELQSLVYQMQRSGLTSLHINSAEYAIRMTCPPGYQPPVTETLAAPEPEVHRVAVTAAMPGRIWLQDPLSGKNIGPDPGPVEEGALLALLQVGQICLPVRAPQAGIITAIDVQQGQSVEYDQPLMQLQTEEQSHAQHRS